MTQRDRDILLIPPRRSDQERRRAAHTDWHLDETAERYDKFLSRYMPLARSGGALGNEASFVIRFAVVFDYLEAAWQDPELPAELLPSKWSGAGARRLARDLYKRLLPGALAFGDSLQ